MGTTRKWSLVAIAALVIFVVAFAGLYPG